MTKTSRDNIKNKLIYISSCLMVVVYLVIFPACEELGLMPTIESNWKQTLDRYWVGSDYWANRLQDWRVHDGRLECINSQRPLRTVHLVSGELESGTGKIKMNLTTGFLSDSARNGDAWAGFLIGAGSLQDDYRLRALIHQAHGTNGGFIAAVNGRGKIVFLDNANQRKKLPARRNTTYSRGKFSGDSIELKLVAEAKEEKCRVLLEAFDKQSGTKIDSAALHQIPPERLAGNVALAAHMPSNKKEPSFWFSNWKVWGSKLSVIEDRRLGPVIGVQYTISEGILNLTAQMAPISEMNQRAVKFEAAPKGTDDWKIIAESEITRPGWLATFRVKEWNTRQTYRYRISYPLAERKRSQYFEGTIQKEPTGKNDFTAAAFSDNTSSDSAFGERFDFSGSRIWFPHHDIIQNVQQHEPDLLVYTGDQVHKDQPVSPDTSSSISTRMDYLYRWYLFLWAHGELTRNIPTITIPDDQDVYQDNLWGAEGKKAEPLPEGERYPWYYRGGFENHYQQDRGGYVMPPKFVNMVQQTQTAHLPEPYDAKPVRQGIGVYYTDITYGGMSFAVLEDRKFKSPPSVELPEARIVNGFSLIEDISPEELRAPGASLYGERQLNFLRHWAGEWENADMKATISQTIPACLSTYPDTLTNLAGPPKIQPPARGEVPENDVKAKDMDSNGWPLYRRDEALREIRKGFALMIGGDRHLASLVHHGINNWGDAGYSYCVPSIAKTWSRRWFPADTGRNHQPGLPPYTGQYYDGFGNPITVWAAANPYQSRRDPERLHNHAPGFGIIRFHKNKQQITLECWPRYTRPDSDHQYPGWPKTIDMEENYGRVAEFMLPSILTKGLDKSPVYKILEEPDNRLIYARRAKDSIFQPKVFREGSYTVIVGIPATNKMDTLRNVEPIETKKQIIIDFRE